jgi:hypothetical protein
MVEAQPILVPSTTPGVEPKGPSRSEPPASQVAAFADTLRAVRAALDASDALLAKQEIERARTVAVTEEQQGEVESLRVFVQAAEDFGQAVRHAATTLPAATEVELGDGSLISIVETGPQRLIVRARGVNKRYSHEAVPLGLEVALGEHVLDGKRPHTAMQKAAYVLLSRKADAEDKARAASWLRDIVDESPEAKQILAVLPK